MKHLDINEDVSIIKNKIQFYIGLIASGFLTISVLNAPVTSAATRGFNVGSVAPQIACAAFPTPHTSQKSGNR